ncbi:MAG TPA: hypothetical protein VGE57_07795 [Solimonas sp.]
MEASAGSTPIRDGSRRADGLRTALACLLLAVAPAIGVTVAQCRQRWFELLTREALAPQPPRE